MIDQSQFREVDSIFHFYMRNIDAELIKTDSNVSGLRLSNENGPPPCSAGGAFLDTFRKPCYGRSVCAE